MVSGSISSSCSDSSSSSSSSSSDCGGNYVEGGSVAPSTALPRATTVMKTTPPNSSA